VNVVGPSEGSPRSFVCRPAPAFHADLTTFNPRIPRRRHTRNGRLPQSQSQKHHFMAPEFRSFALRLSPRTTFNHDQIPRFQRHPLSQVLLSLDSWEILLSYLVITALHVTAVVYRLRCARIRLLCPVENTSSCTLRTGVTERAGVNCHRHPTLKPFISPQCHLSQQSYAKHLGTPVVQIRSTSHRL
jgi:hypothetical protein